MLRDDVLSTLQEIFVSSEQICIDTLLTWLRDPKSDENEIIYMRAYVTDLIQDYSDTEIDIEDFFKPQISYDLIEKIVEVMRLEYGSASALHKECNKLRSDAIKAYRQKLRKERKIPFLSLRSRILQRVDLYCSLMECDHDLVWRALYRHLKYSTGYDAYSRSSAKQNKLESVERDGYLDDLMNVCDYLLSGRVIVE